MKCIATFLFLLALSLTGGFVRGQSVNTVKYKVTYDATTQLYTAYVVPDYNVPNAFNRDSTKKFEKGSTAQFTLVVPRNFVITQITDINGTWPTVDALPAVRLGPGQSNQNWAGDGLDADLNYYVLGKAAIETNYGVFQKDQPVALFTFKGNGCYGPIQPLAPNDPFIAAADNRYSLTVANSFNSRSAQPAGGNQNPLEQFVTITGTPAYCSSVPTLVASPDNTTTTSGIPTTTPVLANDTNTGRPASTTNVTVSISTPPTAGTATVNPDGTITFTPPTTFVGTICYAYKICDLTSTTVCSAPAQVCVTVVAPTSLTANPDNTTTTAGTPTTTPVLANDTNTGRPASTTNVTVSISTPPTAGTAIVNPDGTITFTPPTTFVGTICYAYKICDLTSTTVCSAPAQVCVTVVPKPTGVADIMVTKRLVGSKVHVLGDVVSFNIVVKNLGPDPATNILVRDSLTTGFQFQSASITKGIGNYTNPLLTIPALASGDSVVLSVSARLIADGVSFNYVRILSLDQNDPNLINNTDKTCVSVPMNLCTGDAIVATAPASLINVQWFKSGVLVGSGNSITLTEGGTYTFSATNSTCPVEECCPLIIVQTDCCPVNACVPFVITKTRKSNR